MAGVKGRGGPKPSHELRALHGTDRPDRQPARGPEPALLVAVTEPPSDLNPTARREWNRIAPELVRLHLLSNLDLGALVGYCRAFADGEAAHRHIRKHGRYTFVKGYGFRLNPAVRDAYRASQTMRQFIVEFGMSPSSRARVITGGGGATAMPDGKDRPRPINRLGQPI